MLLLLLIFSLFSITLAACPGGFPELGPKGRCVQLIREADEFSSAELTCRDMGGHLLSIHSGFENTQLLALAIQGGLAGMGIHLGAYRRSNGTDWKWRDGTNFTYAHWAPGQPSFESTVELDLTDGNWYTTNRDTIRPFFCALPPQDATKCDADWIPSRGYCYNLQEYSLKSADEAEDFCQKSNAHLVSIHSKVEQEFVLAMVSRHCRDPALGLSCGPTGIYAWTDGTDYNFAENKQCSPVYAMSACGKDAGSWRGIDDDSTNFEAFICKKPGNK